MPVIKANQTSGALRSAVVLDMGDLGRQADQIKEAARREAQRLLDEAGQEARQAALQVHSEALEQGKQDGERQGREQGLETGRREAVEAAAVEMAALQEQWSGALRQWEDRTERLFEEARRDVIELALLLTERVVHRAIEIDDSLVVDRLGTILREVLSPLDLRIVAHPLDRPILEKAMPDLLKETSGLEHVTFEDDDSIARGGCVVLHGQGRIDATIHTALRRIVELMLPEPPDAGGPEPKVAEAPPPEPPSES